jgi:outer membrane PBP1 activator LpoA protein
MSSPHPLQALLRWLAVILTAAACAGPRAAAGEPHIALLLPLDSAAFARHADAVRQGVLAAAKLRAEGALPVRLYATGDGDTQVLAAYERAVESGARLVLGPLARHSVAALAASPVVTVPTLALSQPERDVALPPRMYVLALNVETEVRQIAAAAVAAGRRRAAVIATDTPLGQRTQRAFFTVWTQGGGTVVAEPRLSGELAELPRVRQALAAAGVDVAFLALSPARARALRPALDAGIALYAGSEINPGTPDPALARELAGIRFVDMPWRISPQHPAVMVYPRAGFDDPDLDRLYALGIDALRAGERLLDAPPTLTLDGVTGLLRLGRDRVFSRELTLAVFEGGAVRVLSEPAR